MIDNEPGREEIRQGDGGDKQDPRDRKQRLDLLFREPRIATRVRNVLDNDREGYRGADCAHCQGRCEKRRTRVVDYTLGQCYWRSGRHGIVGCAVILVLGPLSSTVTSVMRQSVGAPFQLDAWRSGSPHLM